MDIQQSLSLMMMNLDQKEEEGEGRRKEFLNQDTGRVCESCSICVIIDEGRCLLLVIPLLCSLILTLDLLSISFLLLSHFMLHMNNCFDSWTDVSVLSFLQLTARVGDASFLNPGNIPVHDGNTGSLSWRRSK